jgi:hypothetical protein
MASDSGKPRRDAASPAPGAAPARPAHRRGAQQLAALIQESLQPVARARGFANTAMHQHWGSIVGEGMARHCEPVALAWPVRREGSAEAPREGAVLTVRVSGAFALELQHMAPVVVDRINAHLGWRCVARLVLKQGPVSRPAPVPRVHRTLTPEQSQRINALTADIEHEPLRKALQGLGVAVLSRQR